MTASTTSPHAWLSRLSDYHSGGVGDAERIAVEAHLATCAECQEALAMYRRFYTLLHSPLTLGGPSAHFDDPTVILDTRVPRSQPGWHPGGPAPRGPRNRRALAGIAAVLAAALVIAGFIGVFASRLHAPRVAATPTAQQSVTPQPTGTAEPTATPQPTSTAAPLAWSQYGSAGAIQIWVAATGGAPRLLATIPATEPAVAGQCSLVSAGLPMPSPDGRHLLVGLGQQCASFILDPGPLAILDTTSGQLSYVPLPSDATVLPQVRSYGWADNQTIFAIAYDADLAFKGAFLYTLGASSVTALNGLQTPLEGVVRGATLFYLSVGSGSSGIQPSLRRYDLTRHAPLPGSISLGAYTSCSECPIQVISPGWDASPDGSHVVYQFIAPKAGGGFASSKIVYAGADGSAPRQIAQYLATSSFIHLRLAPDGARVAITAAFPSPTVVSACVGSAGAKGDPCFVTYTPDAVSIAAWAPDGRSFVAGAVDASYGQPTSPPGALIRYTLGTSAGRLFVSGGYSPWSSPEATSS